MSPDRDRPLKRVFDSQWFISALRFARWPRRTMNRPADTGKPDKSG